MGDICYNRMIVVCTWITIKEGVFCTLPSAIPVVFGLHCIESLIHGRMLRFGD